MTSRTPGGSRVPERTDVRWATVFLDVAAGDQSAAERFWTAVTGTTLSARRGPDGEFVTLVPGSGDAYLRLQRIRTGLGGVHLDLHADDPDALARRGIELGATSDLPHPDLPRLGLRSPGGFPWCAVPWRGETVTPPPVITSGEAITRLDQLALDIPAESWTTEVAFWARLTGWTLTASTFYPEFSFLTSTVPSPLRILLQRLGEPSGSVRGHLDFAAGDDVDAAAARHAELGARVGRRFTDWQVMIDPRGQEYCLTHRPA